jgi:hypothetical protein
MYICMYVYTVCTVYTVRISLYQGKIISVSYLYMRFPLIYINFNFDFLDLHNVFFENYFANELTID